MSTPDLFDSLKPGHEATAATPRDEGDSYPEPVLSHNALRVLSKRYLRRSEDGRLLETPGGMFRRVAEAVAAAEQAWGGDATEWAGVFYRMMTKGEFLPNSPTLINAGGGMGQLSACFVLPVEDSMESIFNAVKNTALIHKSGGGTGFSFSRIRPAQDLVRTTMGVSSGPISFMTVFDRATDTVKQGGVRRGANMAVLRVDHPDIMAFINCKRDMANLNNFNLSVAITDSFLAALEAGGDYGLVNPRTREVTGALSAREVFGAIVDSAWASGEPGIIFIDLMNRANPTPLVGDIEATNPCGEQPLLPYEACNLGSVNLSVMGVPETRSVDWNLLEKTVRCGIRFLDDVIQVNRYPLPEIATMVAGNRKIGMGVMGFAELLFSCGIPYDSDEALGLAERIMSFIADKALGESVELAKQRGAFPNFKGSVYDRNGMPPVRNATVTTIAPTGSISIIAGCSSGIEPVFALAFTRRNLLDEGEEMREVVPFFEKVARERGFGTDGFLSLLALKGSLAGMEEVPEDVRKIFVTSHDISPEWHVRMQAAFQKFTDNAVSKTVNLPRSATREDVARVFLLAGELGCKGVTVYRDGSRDRQVLNLGRSEPVVEKTPASEPRSRPEFVSGITRRMKTGCGDLFVTINRDEKGPVEVFSRLGKAGGCASSQGEALCRIISLALSNHVPPEAIVRELRGISCNRPGWQGGQRINSCADAIALALETGEAPKEDAGREPDETPSRHTGACPNCGAGLKHESGCVSCELDCGYTECG
ncbi:MAG: vitamin B12-dependent ribonucleotide reductase [Candidatus Fermentibacteraceae bacterium]